MRKRLTSSLVIIAVISVGFISLVVDTLMAPVPERKLAHLSRGTTTSNEVVRLFGAPQRILGDHTGHAWRYRPRLRMGYLDLAFDASGRLTDYNFERW